MNISNLTNHIKYDNIFEQCKINGKINWKLVSEYNNLSQEFIDKYFFQLKPFQIEQKQFLSVPLLKKYFCFINWYILSSYQEIPEFFIAEKIKRFDNQTLISIIKYQKLSLKFLLKHIFLFKKPELIQALKQNYLINDSIKNIIITILTESKLI